MAFPPVAIFIGGQLLEQYTSMSLTRSKENLTGSCKIEVFFNYLPTSPVLIEAAASKELLVYIGGQLAFTGTIDTRNGSGTKVGTKRRNVQADEAKGSAEASADRSASISSDGYTVTISARGKTKRLIDSSHQHNKTNMLQPTTKKALETLLQPFKVQIDWMGEEIKLDKIRFRDGAKVIEEIRRIASENGYYIYETRDGKLRVTDALGPGSGEPLILGENILSFSASQSEEHAQSEITVKGQRSKKGVWGDQAVTQDTSTVFKDQWVQSYSPVVIQHYGDGTKEALERRARFEANRRSSQSKTVTIDVFHVMTNGEPWDIGTTHYVEVPPEGIFDNFECTELTYTVSAKELKTSLTLSPPASGQKGAKGLATFAGAEQSTRGISQQSALRVSVAPGNYPFPWAGPTIEALAQPAVVGILDALASVTGLDRVAQNASPETPPLTLPAEFNQ